MDNNSKVIIEQNQIIIETIVTPVEIITVGMQGPAGTNGIDGSIDYPTFTNNANKVLTVKTDETGVEWTTVSSGGVALGETSSTAYRGDRGKIAYDHSLSQGNPHNTTTSDINEGTKLFFTESRVNQTVLTGLNTSTATPALATDQLLAAIGKLQAQINNVNPSAAMMPVNAQTGTAYTLALTDAGNCVEMNNASANTLTIPPNSTVAYGVGTTILIRQMGVGQTTLVADSGVTIRNPHGTLKLFKQYTSVALHKRGTDEWCIEGNLAES